jgi:hypothetical protein
LVCLKHWLEWRRPQRPSPMSAYALYRDVVLVLFQCGYQDSNDYRCLRLWLPKGCVIMAKLFWVSVNDSHGPRMVCSVLSGQYGERVYLTMSSQRMYAPSRSGDVSQAYSSDVLRAHHGSLEYREENREVAMLVCNAGDRQAHSTTTHLLIQ